MVDNVVCSFIYSFMDGFSGYNLIKIAPEDKEKKNFYHAVGNILLQVMPFELKNAGATY